MLIKQKTITAVASILVFGFVANVDELKKLVAGLFIKRGCAKRAIIPAHKSINR